MILTPVFPSAPRFSVAPSISNFSHIGQAIQRHNKLIEHIPPDNRLIGASTSHNLYTRQNRRANL